MSSILEVQQDDEEHEVHGAEIPLDDVAMDTVNSEIPDEEKLKNLHMIMNRLEKIEQEAEILRQTLAQMETAERIWKESLAEKRVMDSRSIYVGNVDYYCKHEELLEHFKSCGIVNRVTIPTDDFAMPKGFAYVEFDKVDAVQPALALNGTFLRGRQIKVARKRTNIPGMTQYRGPRGYPGRLNPNNNDPYYVHGPVRRRSASYRYRPY